jgi:hypothetical protein
MSEKAVRKLLTLGLIKKTSLFSNFSYIYDYNGYIVACESISWNGSEYKTRNHTVCKSLEEALTLGIKEFYDI